MPMVRASCPAMENSCIHSAKNPLCSTGGTLSNVINTLTFCPSFWAPHNQDLEPYSSRPFEPDVASVTEYDDQVLRDPLTGPCDINLMAQAYQDIYYVAESFDDVKAKFR